ncbi:helix-turn-helix domain-containing protein [Actinoplanes sp. CA-142083]|uniref:helix-turn-helix domain-containing protein n=1 Tax=Actinoplanes sp. CA-142083 TaxID=3239903 RepID=UPI003D91D4E2
MTRPAPTPPPGLWERPDMAEALAERDFGAVFRIYRRWTGSSQTDVGSLVGLPQPHVSEIERGSRHVLTLDVVERIIDGLGIPRQLAGLAEGRRRRREDPVTESQEDWMAARRFLGRQRRELTHAVYALYPDAFKVGDTGILIPPGWRLTEPIDLTEVSLQWREHTPQPAVNGGERETRAVRPLVSAGQEYTRYHRAMRDLARPRLFENRLCYRLLDVAPAGGRLDMHLTLGGMCYFDMIDVGEALAHEAALAGQRKVYQGELGAISWEGLPFRRLLRDPFDLAAYPLMISVSTLTVRASKAGSTFFLMRRNPAKVAIAGGMLSVFPTGVFQPASVVPAPDSPDFDLWRNVMREFSEEYLGNPEHDGDGPPIDYANTEPFRSLDAARAAGRIRVYCLGVGVDALNYVGDVLTVAIFDAEVFDEIFGKMVDHNDEGEVESEEFPFTPETIRRLLVTESFAPSGAACLALAEQHFELLR